MPSFYGAIDLLKNELRNAVVQNLGAAPGTPSPGQLYYNSAGNVLYWWNGTTWVAAQGGASVSYGSATDERATGFGSAAADGVATTVSRSDHAHGNPYHGDAQHSTIHLNALAAPTNSWQNGGFLISNLGTPSGASDAATKGYVDNVLAGLSWKQEVRAASTADHLSPPQGAGAVDGVTIAAGDRILLKNQTNATENGIWIVVSGSNWTRATDADSGPELVNATVFVSEGSTQADTAWVQTVNAPITIGSTNLTFVQFGAGGTAYTAGNGLTLAANQFNVAPGDTTLTATPGSLVVNTSVIATQAYVNSAVTGMSKKFAATLTGTASPEVITHNLNTRDIYLSVLNGASPYTAVVVDWDATTVNTATIRYNPNLGAGYRVVIFG